MTRQSLADQDSGGKKPTLLSNQLQNSSAGIINTLQYARTFIRPAPVDAAIGGFHLFRATDEQLDWTADKLKEYKTSQVLRAHCTGIQSVYHLRQRMGLTRRTCIVGSVGATYDLKDGIQTGLISR